MVVLYFLRLIRIWNSLLVLASVFIGILFAGVLSPAAPVVLACVSAFLIASGGYGVNDYFDYRIDLVNKPLRPIPRGDLKRMHALVVSLLLMGAGIVIAHLISGELGLVAAATAGLLILYSYVLKRLVFVGNLVVSLLCGLVFVYGGMSVGKIGPTLVPAAFSFLFHLGREILKDVEDVEGDRKGGAHTIPVRSGRRLAIILSTLIYLLLIALTPVPYATGMYSWRYLISVVVLVDVSLMLTTIYVWRRDANYGTANRVLKLIMPLGLLSLYLGR